LTEFCNIKTQVKTRGLSAGTGAHCPSFVCETLWFHSILEFNCFLSIVSFVLRHSLSGTHRRNQDLKMVIAIGEFVIGIVVENYHFPEFVCSTRVNILLQCEIVFSKK